MLIKTKDKYYKDNVEITKEQYDNYIAQLPKPKELTEEEKWALGYEERVIALIRSRYSIDQELAILRQRDVKPQEFEEYNSFVEECKKQAKEK